MTFATISAVKPPYPSLPADQEWPSQGQWTYEDFLRLPEDGVRYEIIDGVLYMTNAPEPEHQYVVHKLSHYFENVVEAENLGVIYPAPIEVRLPEIAQPVQPDILFIATSHLQIVHKQFIEGAPDLIVEVLSPGTQKRDRQVKYAAYQRAGVREYWIVNPKVRSVEVYALLEGEYELHGEFGPGEKATSTLLSGLELLTNSIFPSA